MGQNIPPSTQAWTIESGTHKDQEATVGEMLAAIRSPEFARIASGNPKLSAAIGAIADGMTEAEGHAFDVAVHATPGALKAFEAALGELAGARWIVDALSPNTDGSPHVNPETGLYEQK